MVGFPSSRQRLVPIWSDSHPPGSSSLRCGLIFASVSSCGGSIVPSKGALCIARRIQLPWVGRPASFSILVGAEEWARRALVPIQIRVHGGLLFSL
jgi:hypothetical protein